jgi:phosphate transport system permease protein
MTRVMKKATARLRIGDAYAHAVAFLFGASVVGLTGMLAWELWRNSALSRQAFGFSFFVSQTWDPVAGQFGALPFVFGTLMTSGIALLIAVPLGIGVAIFLAELAPPRLSATAGMLLELLAAVPSVIYGLLGVAVLVPLMREWIQPGLKALVPGFPLFGGPAYGIGLLTAGLVLAIMIVPFIVSVGREVLLSVPREQREAALALGATRWESTWKVVLPYARPGLYGAIFLALGRALGETMAVTMVIGNRPEIVASLFAPAYSMAAVIANEFSEATEELYLHSLIEVGLVLFLLTMVVNAVARGLIAATTESGSAR